MKRNPTDKVMEKAIKLATQLADLMRKEGTHDQWLVLLDQMLERDNKLSGALDYQIDSKKRVKEISEERAWDILRSKYWESIHQEADSIKQMIARRSLEDEDEVYEAIDQSAQITYNNEAILAIIGTPNDDEVFEMGELNAATHGRGANAQDIYNEIAYWAQRRDIMDAVGDIQELLEAAAEEAED